MHSDRKVEQIIQVWKTCFGDEESEIAFFFDYFKEKVTTYTYEVEESVVSILNLLPAQIVTKAGVKDASYIYGVATLPEFRKRGYSSDLIKQAIDAEGEKGNLVFLVPAQQQLQLFYEKLGFSLCAKAQIITVDEKEIMSQADKLKTVPQIGSFSPESYQRLREKAFFKEGFFTGKQQMTSYALKLWLEDGGCCKNVICDEKEYGILYKLHSKRLEVLEITEEDDAKALSLVAGIGRKLEATEIILRRGYDVMIAGGEELSINEGYFNLAMD